MSSLILWIAGIVALLLIFGVCVHLFTELAKGLWLFMRLVFSVLVFLPLQIIKAILGLIKCFLQGVQSAKEKYEKEKSKQVLK